MSVELTAKQSEWLEHVRRASEQGLSLRGYANNQGLSVKGLYNARETLIKRGAWPDEPWPKTGCRVKRRSALQHPSTQMQSVSTLTSPAAFVPVRLSTDVSHAAMPCRLRHASGWVMECEALPPAAWLNALVQVNHAAP